MGLDCFGHPWLLRTSRSVAGRATSVPPMVRQSRIRLLGDVTLRGRDMVVFDQRRHPMRFAVAVSTVSGLLVILLTAAFEKVFRLAISGRALLPWALAVSGWALAAVTLVLQ